MPVPEFVGEARGVGGGEQIFETPERRIGRQWLAFKDVERGSRNLVRAESIGQRGFVDLRAAANVNEVRGPLHGGKAGGIDQAFSGFDQRGGDDDKIGLTEQL